MPTAVGKLEPAEAGTVWCVDLRKRGANPRLSATTVGNGPWCLARSNALELALPDVYFACLGIPRARG